MKVDFMKMNASKTNKKISFKACASVLVIQAAVFGFYGSAEAMRTKPRASGTHQADVAEQGRQRRVAVVAEVGGELDFGFPGFVGKISQTRPNFLRDVVLEHEKNTNVPIAAALWTVISGHDDLFTFESLEVINQQEGLIRKVGAAFLVASGCHDLGERPLRNAVAVLQRFGVGNYTFDELTRVDENVLALADVLDDNLLAPYAHGVLLDVFNVGGVPADADDALPAAAAAAADDADDGAPPRLVAFEETLNALDELVNSPLGYDRVTPELVRGFVGLNGDDDHDLEGLKQRYIFFVSRGLNLDDDPLREVYDRVREGFLDLNRLTQDHLIACLESPEREEDVLFLERHGVPVGPENPLGLHFNVLDLMREKRAGRAPQVFAIFSRACAFLNQKNIQVNGAADLPEILHPDTLVKQDNTPLGLCLELNRRELSLEQLTADDFDFWANERALGKRQEFLKLAELRAADGDRQQNRSQINQLVAAIVEMRGFHVPYAKITFRTIDDFQEGEPAVAVADGDAVAAADDPADLRRNRVVRLINGLSPEFYGAHSRVQLLAACDFAEAKGLDMGDDAIEPSLNLALGAIAHLDKFPQDDGEEADDYRDRMNGYFLAYQAMKRFGAGDVHIKRSRMDAYADARREQKPVIAKLTALGLGIDRDYIGACLRLIEEAVEVENITAQQVISLVVPDLTEADVRCRTRIAQLGLEPTLLNLDAIALVLDYPHGHITAPRLEFLATALGQREGVEAILELYEKNLDATHNNLQALGMLVNGNVERDLRTPENIRRLIAQNALGRRVTLAMLRSDLHEPVDLERYSQAYGEFLRADVPQPNIARPHVELALEGILHNDNRLAIAVGLALLGQEINDENQQAYRHILEGNVPVVSRTVQLFDLVLGNDADVNMRDAAIFCALRGIPLEFGPQGRGKAILDLRAENVNLLGLEPGRLEEYFHMYFDEPTVQSRRALVDLLRLRLPLNHKNMEVIGKLKSFDPFGVVSHRDFENYPKAVDFLRHQDVLVDVLPERNLHACLSMFMGDRPPHISFVDAWILSYGGVRKGVEHLSRFYDEIQDVHLAAIRDFFDKGLREEEEEVVVDGNPFISLPQITKGHVDAYSEVDERLRGVVAHLVVRGTEVSQPTIAVCSQILDLAPAYMSRDLVMALKDRQREQVPSILALVGSGFDRPGCLDERNIEAAGFFLQNKIKHPYHKNYLDAVKAAGGNKLERDTVMRLSVLGLSLNHADRPLVSLCLESGVPFTNVSSQIVAFLKGKADALEQRAAARLLGALKQGFPPVDGEFEGLLAGCRSMMEDDLPNDVITLNNIRAFGRLDAPRKPNALTLFRLNLPVQEANLSAVQALQDAGVVRGNMRVPYVEGYAQAVVNGKKKKDKDNDLGSVDEVSALALKGTDPTKENVSAYRALIAAGVEGDRLTAQDVGDFAAIPVAPVPAAAAAAAADPAPAVLPAAGEITRNEFVALLMLGLERDGAYIAAYRDVIATGLPADRIEKAFMEYYLRLNDAQRTGILHALRVKANMRNSHALVNVYTQAVQQGVNPAFLNKSVFDGLARLTPAHLTGYIGYIKEIENRGKRLAEFAILTELKKLDDAGNLQHYNDFINGLDDMAAV